MKIVNSKKYNKKKYIILYGILLSVLLSSCKSNNTNNSEIIKEKGMHKIIKIDKKYNPLIGKNGVYELASPDGYKILDYDYDHEDNFDFNNYLYENTCPVKLNDLNTIGTPIKESINNKTIAYINRNINLLYGKSDQVIHLKVPDNFKLIDYDYDLTKNFEFENMTFNTRLDNIDSNIFNNLYINYDDNIVDTSKDIMVVINRNINLLYGKSGSKQVSNIDGYKIIDYDYDKSDDFEFETIVYENTCPVRIFNNGIGIPLDKINKNESNIYDVGSHVITNINLGINLLYGDSGYKEVKNIDGYELIDYDYDINDSIEYETYTYKNSEKVIVDNPDSFGKVLKK